MDATIEVPTWDAVAAALVSDDQALRSIAAHWFQRQWHAPAGVDRYTAIRGIRAAYDRYGTEAFDYAPQLDVPIDDESIEWLIERGATVSRTDDDRAGIGNSAFDSMSARQLATYGPHLKDALEKSAGTSADYVTPDRLGLVEFVAVHANNSADELWAAAIECCRIANEKSDRATGELIALAELLAATGKGADFKTPARALLSDPATLGKWEESWAIYVCARVGLAGTADCIVARLVDPANDEYVDTSIEAVEAGLWRLPPDEAAAAYLALSDSQLIDLSLYMTFAQMPYAAVVARCLACAATAKRDDAAMYLHAALCSLAPQAIGPAVRHLTAARTIEGSEFDTLEALECAVAFHGIDVPELDAIRAKPTPRRRLGFGAAQARPRTDDDFGAPGVFETAALNAMGEGILDPLQRGERVGRNDPCPCGSGKKYKKCCMP